MCHVRKLICNYYVIDEHDYLGQYQPYGIPYETMLCYFFIWDYFAIYFLWLYLNVYIVCNDYIAV